MTAAFEWPERVGVGSMTPYSSDQSCQATTSSWSLSRSSVGLNAYREVEDALVAVRTYPAELDARLREVRAAESAAELSWIRYEDGVTSYLEVLETQRALFTSQIATSQTRQLALASVVELYGSHR